MKEKILILAAERCRFASRLGGLLLLSGKPLFLGRVPVIDGKFDQSILVPEKVVFDKAGARLTAYA